MAHKDIEKMSFEEALSELETIVARLEQGDAALEESIDVYERGAKLKKYCEDKLKAAQLKVDKIVLGNDGNVQTAPLDSENG